MMLLLSFLVGAVSWTLAEYLLHRFRGHEAKKPNVFRTEHLTHHAKHGYFTPTGKKFTHATPVILAATGLLCLGVGLAAGLAWGVGFSLAYMGYEVTHRRLHTHGPRGPWSRLLRRHHFFHHFHDGRVNHGVTSPFWDVVFGTRVVAERIEVPRKFVPDWLCDATGGVRPELANDYSLRSRSGGPT